MSDLHFIPDEPRPIAPRGMRVTTLMVIVLVLGCSLGLLARGYKFLMEAVGNDMCINNLKQIGLALHNYHDVYGCFPPPFIADANGKPMHSWRMLITPFAEGNFFYEQYRFDEPWNSPHNQTLADQYNPSFYTCPNRWSKPGLTSYVMIVGPKTLAPGTRSITLSDIRDGADQTIMVVEVANIDIPWTEPRDLDFETMRWVINDPSKPSISSPHKCLASSTPMDL